MITRRSLFLMLLGSLLLGGCGSLRTLVPGITPTIQTVQAPAPSGPDTSITLGAETATAPAPKPTGAVAAGITGDVAGTKWNDWGTYLTALRPQARPAPGVLEDMTQYHLKVDLAPDLSKVAGQADIRYTNREEVPLDVLYLHLFPNLWNGGMTVSRALVAGQPVSVTYPSGDDIIGLPFAQPLQPGESVDLSLQFTTPIPAGSGAGNYGELASQGGVLALAHFYPTVVVYDKGWHLETPSSQGDVIYNDASLYDVTLTAPDGLTIVATGATLDKAGGENGTTTWRLVGGPMRDFNVVASAHYQTASKQVGDVTVNSYFLPVDASGGNEALDWAATALQTYQSEFGAYPYRELDVTEISTSAGGIEYPGMVAISSGLFRDSGGRPFFEGATAHEVAHQWWYNVVGNDQVNDPWLDEALAQYSTYLYFRDVYGDQGAKGFEDSLKERWARVEYVQKPIGLPVKDYVDKEYGAIVYGRGPLFFLALRDQIGEEKMATLLRQYYSEYAWQVVTPAEFQALAESVSGQDLGPLFKQWVYPQ